MNETSFFLKGDICWSLSPESLGTGEDSYLLCLDGKSGGVFWEIPKQYAHLPVMDHSGMLIIPGLADLHTHAPQFSFRALGMDMELLEWLEKNTFPEEAKYRDLKYAAAAYSRFIDIEKKGPNTRLCVFATVHTDASLLLMEMLEESGLVSLVGKVNMDRNCPSYLREGCVKGVEPPGMATMEWLETYYKHRGEGRYKNTAPILTPRFIPCCSNELMKNLSLIQREHGLPLQSHLSENLKEIEWVKELGPKSDNYADAYDDAGLLEGPTIMAHCVWPSEEEMDLLARKGIYIAHCPQSNINLSSGIAPVRRFLERGIPVGLGSDVAGGAHHSIFRAITDAIQVSKLRQTLIAPDDKALTLEEAFYLGSAGGGSFFAKSGCGAPSGSFESGWDFDALIIDEHSLENPAGLNIRQRLERVVYLSDDRNIAEKYVRGIKLKL